MTQHLAWKVHLIGWINQTEKQNNSVITFSVKIFLTNCTPVWTKTVCVHLVQMLQLPGPEHNIKWKTLTVLKTQHRLCYIIDKTPMQAIICESIDTFSKKTFLKLHSYHSNNVIFNSSSFNWRTLHSAQLLSSNNNVWR